MKSKLFCLSSIIFLVGVFCMGVTPAHAAKIRVVTTLTDLADFARAVGGDLVEVHSLATGVEDTHGVPMKPSFVPMMNRADLMILVGFGLRTRLSARVAGSEQKSAHPGRQVRLCGLLQGHRPARCAQVNRALRGRCASLRQPALHARSRVGQDRDREYL